MVFRLTEPSSSSEIDFRRRAFTQRFDQLGGVHSFPQPPWRKNFPAIESFSLAAGKGSRELKAIRGGLRMAQGRVACSDRFTRREGFAWRSGSVDFCFPASPAFSAAIQDFDGWSPDRIGHVPRHRVRRAWARDVDAKRYDAPWTWWPTLKKDESNSLPQRRVAARRVPLRRITLIKLGQSTSCCAFQLPRPARRLKRG